MRLFLLLFAAILVGAFSLAAVSESDGKPKSKPRGGFVTPTPRPKSAKSADDAEPNSTTPKPRKKSTPSATPKAKPNETAPEKQEAKATPAFKDEIAKPSAATPPPTESAAGKPVASASGRAPAATLDPDDLREFAAQPARVQQLISAALELTKLNLTYTYGSADPAKGGMDCSGTMYHLLRAQGFTDVPRDSSGQYAWARKRGPFFAVVGKGAESFEFGDILPGDLLFWTGTYEVKREIPISHVMLYLGTEKKTKKRVMFGASDGRTYSGIQRWGVSVFDFKMPREGGGERADFVGYARIPGLRDPASPIAETAATSDHATEEPAPQPAVTPAPKSTGKKSTKTGASKSATPASKKKSSSRAE